jgi:hypothetical protein
MHRSNTLRDPISSSPALRDMCNGRVVAVATIYRDIDNLRGKVEWSATRFDAKVNCRWR